MYADDSTLHFAAPSINLLEDALNTDLGIVNNWVDCNRLALNTKKTKCMLLGSRHKVVHYPRLTLNLGGVTIQQVENIKLLGVMVDSSLS